MSLPKYFRADAINIACHILNRIIIRSILEQTSYELLKGRKPNISHFHVFACKCFILNNEKDKLDKFDAKDVEGIFLGYSLSSKPYKVLNNTILVVEEYVYVAFDETKLQETETGISCVIGFLGVNTKGTVNDDASKVYRPKDEDIKDDEEENEQGVINKSTHLQLNNFCNYSAFISQVELKIVSNALNDESWLPLCKKNLTNLK